MRRAALVTGVFLASVLVGCSKEGGDDSPRGEPSASASAATSAAPAAPLAPELAAIKAGSWKDPYGGPDTKLVDTPLGKCFGFKGYAMKLPEGSRLQTLTGARACGVYPPSSTKEEWGLVVFTDEIKVDHWKKEDLKDAKTKPFEEEDAFLWTVERKGREVIIGFFEKKIGPRTVRCNSLIGSEKTVLTFATERALLELCRTVTYSEP